MFKTIIFWIIIFGVIIIIGALMFSAKKSTPVEPTFKIEQPTKTIPSPVQEFNNLKNAKG